MTRRIWTKPFIKYNLSGDRTVAKSLERRARACVGYLFDQLMPNQKFRSQNWNYPDGSRITAFVWRDALGERARVEIFAGGETESFSLFYMDSGFVDIGETQGLMSQNNVSRALYSNAKYDLRMSPFAPKSGVDGWAVPPSFQSGGNYAGKASESVAYPPGDYTGKLRWLISGQHGLRVNDDAWIEHETSFTREHAPNPRVTGEGIYTTDEGEYWYLRIDGTGDEIGEAVRLSIPLGANGGSAAFTDASDIQRLRETHVLAVARKTEETRPIVFSGDTFWTSGKGLPFSYGWHFDRNGRRAAIVTHTTTVLFSSLDDFKLIVRTRMFEASITRNEAGEFSFSVEETYNEEWELPPYAVLWKIYLHPTEGWQHVPLWCNDTSDFSAERDFPLSCYFDANDDLKTYNFVYRKEIVENDFGPCHPYILNGVTRTIGWDKPGGNRYYYGLSSGEDRHEDHYGPIVNGEWDSELDISFISTSYTETYGCHRPFYATIADYMGPCPSSERKIIWSYSVTDLTGCQVTVTKNWQDVSYYRATWTKYTNHGQSLGVSLIPPFGGADSYVFATEATEGAIKRYIENTGTNTSPSASNPSGYNWKAQISVSVGQCPDSLPVHICSQINSESSPEGINLAAWPGVETISLAEEDYTITTRFSVFERGARTEFLCGEEATDFIHNQGLWGRWFWRTSLNPQPEVQSSIVRVIPSQIGAVKLFNGREWQAGDGFPEAADTVVGWA